MSLLWCTSYNKPIYDASGARLLHTFQTTETEGDWFIAEEGIKQAEGMDLNYHTGKEEHFGINQSDFYLKWYEENKGYIPEYLGGKAKPCKCRRAWSRSDSDHKKGCYFSWFNRNAFRWFRKIVTLNHGLAYAVENNYNKLLWLDADCYFKIRVTEVFINGLFVDDFTLTNNNPNDILYLKGPRPVLEAGFLGFNLDTDGAYAINKLISVFESGKFRKLIRWDDCYALQRYVLCEKRFKIRDLGTTISGKHSDIFPNSEIGAYIHHNKGRHGRKMGLYK